MHDALDVLYAVCVCSDIGGNVDLLTESLEAVGFEHIGCWHAGCFVLVPMQIPANP